MVRAGWSVLLTLLLALPCGAASGAALHPDSLSSSSIEIEADGRLLVRLRCQVLSLLEVLPALDTDLDGRLGQDELDAGRVAVLDYVRAHYRVGTGSNRALEVERWLELEGLTVEAIAPEALRGSGPGYRDGGVELVLARTPAEPDPLDDLAVEATLFHTTSPDHADLCSIRWPEGALKHLVLDAATPRGRSDPSGRGTLGAFVGLGAEHVLTGWDHLAFVAALALGARGWRRLAGLITAFTVAHSLTLAAAALGWVALGRHGPLIEAAIALSIVWVALSLALDPAPERGRWPEALALGLIHGFGFAGFLADSLVLEEARLKALVGFNLGIEVGQLGFVLALVAALRLIARGSDGFLVARPVRRLGALAILVWAALAFAQRV